MAQHVPFIDYEDIERKVLSGKFVAIAPAFNASGEPNIVMLTGSLSSQQQAALVRSTPAERAYLALKFIRQVREHFEIDTPRTQGTEDEST